MYSVLAILNHVLLVHIMRSCEIIFVPGFVIYITELDDINHSIPCEIIAVNIM